MYRPLIPAAACCTAFAAKNAPWLLSRWSGECTSAVQLQLASSRIQEACGDTFGNGDLLLMIGVGGVAVAVVYWKEAAELVHKGLEQFRDDKE